MSITSRAPAGGQPQTPMGAGGTQTPAGKLAIRRALKRSRDAKGRATGGIVGRVLLIIAIVILVVTGTSVLVAGAAAAALLAQLEAGLPDVKAFETLEFAEPSIVYDREKRELGRFFEEKRNVVTYNQIPRMVLDSTTVVEDRTFWENEGVDLAATIAALASDLTKTADRGGGSTITQQFVRARLLPKDLVNDPDRLYERKAKEIIQSYKLTQALPGEAGKERIITAYLNQIFYGHNAYGIHAAAEVYFGRKLECPAGKKDCRALTLSQAALLAGLPQSPSSLDPYRYAKEGWYTTPGGKRAKGLIVPNCATTPDDEDCVDIQAVVRRNFVLQSLADGHGRWTTLTPDQLEAAIAEPIVLSGVEPNHYKAPHFMVAMREQLDEILADREPAERGGYKIYTTLDLKAQVIAEKYVKAAAKFTGYGYRNYLAALRQYRIGGEDRAWLDFLRGKNIKNASLVALDYRTGDILAYVGSADYYARKKPRVDPKYDVAGIGYRQPGSAWKPILYAAAIDNKNITAGTVLADVTTPMAPNWVPRNAGFLERGPVLVRKALQFSLNIPAIRVMQRVGPSVVGQYSARAGISFLRGRKWFVQAGLAGAIGTVETRQVELTAAYGAFGNGGMVTKPRYLLRVEDAQGKEIYDAGKPVKSKFVTPQTAFIIADILSGNSDTAINPVWGPKFELHNGPGGAFRMMAVKTGTANDIKDLSTYGFLPQPDNPKEPAIALGVWMGNSDHSEPTLGGIPLFASDGAGMIWRAFMRDYMRGKPTPTFGRPGKGLSVRTIDAFTGGVPGPWTKQRVEEYFLSGTEPGTRGGIDKAGLIYVKECGTYMVDLTKAERVDAWKPAVRDWMARARKGQFVTGRYDTMTFYLEDGKHNSWGGPILGPCPTPSPTPTPTDDLQPPDDEPTARPDPTRTPKPTPKPTKKPTPPPDGNGNGGGGGGGGGGGDDTAQAAAHLDALVAALPLGFSPDAMGGGTLVILPGVAGHVPVRTGRRHATR